MKKILLLIVTVLLIGSFVDLQAQAVNDWSWSQPKPMAQTFRWVHMFDANTFYGVGYYGNFIKTTDGGTTWFDKGVSRPYDGRCMYLYDAHFFNMNTGVACAQYGYIFRTTDGGKTWDTCAGTSPQTSTWYRMSFINNNTGFVTGSSARVHKTTNGGISWAPTSDPQAGTSTKYCIYAINANIIMVGESSADIWRTTNGGANWTELLYSGSTVQYIKFLNATTGFFVGSSNLCFKSTNAGANWTTFPISGVQSSSYYDIDFGPPLTPKDSPEVLAEEQFTSTTFPPTGWLRVNVAGTNVWNRQTAQSHSAPASAYIGYQGTGGEDWLITKQFPVSSGDVLTFWWKNAFSAPYPPDSLIIRLSTTTSAIGSFTNIIAKINTATAPYTWTEHTYTLPFSGNVYVAFQHKNTDGNGGYLDDVSVTAPPVPTVYLTGNQYAVYRSPITSPSWDSLGFRSPTQLRTGTMYSSSFSATGDTFLVGGSYGLFNKRNSASNRVCYRTWPYMTSYVNAVGVVGNKVIMPTSYSAIYYTTNNGTTWDTMKTNTSYSSTLYGISTYGNNVWVCGSGSRVNKSTDAGVTWTNHQVTTSSYTLYNVSFVNANTGWVFGTSGRCYKTTNGGTNWTQQTVTGQTSTIYGSSFINANTGWNVGYGGKVYKTTNGGTNWTAQTSKTSQYLRNIDMVDANTGWMVGYYGGVRGTTNGGTDWDTIHVPFGYNSSNDLYGVDFYDPYNGIVTGEYGRTFRTRDGGQSWVFENTGGYYQYGVKMTSTDSAWIAASYGCIFKYAETLTGHNSYTHIVPEKYELTQNYPNPFNPTTTIQFALPKAGTVSLKIYDVSGRLVRNLVNNEGLNEGTFKYIFDGNGIASGVYFYSLIVNDELIGTKKMVLIK